jgi:hypothetical protein
MKLLLTLVLLTIANISHAQSTTPEPSDLVILKFNWDKQRSQIDGIQMIDTVRAVENHRPPPNKNEPERIRNNRDMADRAAELRAGEQDAARSATKATDIYFYLIKVKNVGSKFIKSFVWEYRSSPNAIDTTRQFLCVVKAKPNDSKELEAFSPFAPSKVVDIGPKADISPERGRIVINKIVYGDGTVWERPDWKPPIQSKTNIEKLSAGKCAGL